MRAIPAILGRLGAPTDPLGRVSAIASEDESRRLYDRYHIPASGNVFWGSVLANIHPGHDATWVDYHNAARARCCSSPVITTT